jgi:hypothetical protein
MNYRSFVVLTAFFALTLMPVSAQADASAFFGPSVAENDDWDKSEWFGWYQGAFSPFIWHAEHQWMYVQSAGAWLWMWDYRLQEWFATTGANYPLMYEPVGGNWLWYFEGTAGPRWYGNYVTGKNYTEMRGVLMPEDMYKMMGTAIMASDQAQVDEVNQQLSQVTTLLFEAMADPTISTCPVITMTPETIDMSEEPPAQILIHADFGTGCAALDDGTVVSGSLRCDITNISLTEAGIAATIQLEGYDLAMDGTPVMDGIMDMVVSIIMTSEESSTDTHWIDTMRNTVDVDISMTNLVLGGRPASGSISLEGYYQGAEYVSTTDPSDEFTKYSADMTLGMTNLLTERGTIQSGSVHLLLSEDNSGSVDTALQTDQGAMNLNVDFAGSADGNRMEINTSRQGSMLGYNLTIEGLVFDSVQCPSYPIAGVVTAIFEGATYRMTFDDSCDGNFDIQKW